jgi:hypothetical protein
MNPETKYTNRMRSRWLAQFPEMKIYKHSDRFATGIADLHITMPFGSTAWIEVKYMAKCAKHRNGKVSELQSEYLKEHAANGIPAYVLIGVGKKSAWYRINEFDGSVYAGDLTDDQDVEMMIYDMEDICGNK